MRIKSKKVILLEQIEETLSKIERRGIPITKTYQVEMRGRTETVYVRSRIQELYEQIKSLNDSDNISLLSEEFCCILSALEGIDSFRELAWRVKNNFR